MIIARKSSVAAPRWTSKHLQTVLSAKAKDATMTVHVMTVARIAVTTARLAKDVEEGEHPLEGDVAGVA
jgi:hypothetical protein